MGAVGLVDGDGGVGDVIAGVGDVVGAVTLVVLLVSSAVVALVVLLVSSDAPIMMLLSMDDWSSMAAAGDAWANNTEVGFDRAMHATSMYRKHAVNERERDMLM